MTLDPLSPVVVVAIHFYLFTSDGLIVNLVILT